MRDYVLFQTIWVLRLQHECIVGVAYELNVDPNRVTAAIEDSPLVSQDGYLLELTDQGQTFTKELANLRIDPMSASFINDWKRQVASVVLYRGEPVTAGSVVRALGITDGPARLGLQACVANGLAVAVKQDSKALAWVYALRLPGQPVQDVRTLLSPGMARALDALKALPGIKVGLPLSEIARAVSGPHLSNIQALGFLEQAASGLYYLTTPVRLGPDPAVVFPEVAKGLDVTLETAAYRVLRFLEGIPEGKDATFGQIRKETLLRFQTVSAALQLLRDEGRVETSEPWISPGVVAFYSWRIPRARQVIKPPEKVGKVSSTVRVTVDLEASAGAVADLANLAAFMGEDLGVLATRLIAAALAQPGLADKILGEGVARARESIKASMGGPS